MIRDAKLRAMRRNQSQPWQDLGQIWGKMKPWRKGMGGAQGTYLQPQYLEWSVPSPGGDCFLTAAERKLGTNLQSHCHLIRWVASKREGMT